MNETVSGDSIIVAAVKHRFKPWQVLIADVETAIFADPVGEAVDADEPHIVDVHVLEDAIAVQLKLVAL